MAHNGIDSMGDLPHLAGPPEVVADALRPYVDAWLHDDHGPHARPVRPRDHRPDGRGRGAARAVRVVALAGGTGGAKLAAGLQAVLPPGDLTVIVNTGDDTERHGLLVMPDHDAVLYMLAGTFDFERGWGVDDETWAVMDALTGYGEDAWFRLGDRDFATHIARHARLAGGHAADRPPSVGLQVAAGIPTAILPMTDAPVAHVPSGPTTAGWTSRSTSSIATRSRMSTRSASRASPTRGRAAT